eukprot:scaffold154691_cov31-Tisochrysis_lutea.AAC.4
MPRERRASSATPIVECRLGAIECLPLTDWRLAVAAPRPPSDGRGPARDAREAIAPKACTGPGERGGWE